MCKVKTGAEVSTSVDLQNLVTSTILRQSTPFTVVSIVEQVVGKLAGSEFLENKNAIRMVCEHTVELMELTGSLRSTSDKRYRLTIPFPSYARTWNGAKQKQHR